MKYCYTCKRRRPDTASFCTQCGSSFDVRFCPKMHANSIRAEYCHVCGSSDLSTPDARPRGARTAVLLLFVMGFSVAGGALVAVLLSFRADDAVLSVRTLALMTAGALVIVAWSMFPRRG